MSGPAELGRKGLPQADLLSAAPERRSLRRVGAAGGDCARPSRRLPFAALKSRSGHSGLDIALVVDCVADRRVGGGTLCPVLSVISPLLLFFLQQCRCCRSSRPRQLPPRSDPTRAVFARSKCRLLAAHNMSALVVKVRPCCCCTV